MKKIIWFILLISVILSTGIVFAQDNLSTLIPARKVVIGGNVEYEFLVINNDQVRHEYQFKTSLPESFEKKFIVGQQVTDFLQLPSKSQRIIRLKVKVSDQVAVNPLQFKIIIDREDGRIFTYNLAAVINKNYKIEIIHLPQALNIISGQEIKFNIVLKNMGKNILKHTQLKFDLPGKWLIEKKSPLQTDIKPGETTNFLVKMYVPKSTAAGYKNIKVTAFNENTSISGTIGPVKIQKNPNFLFWVITLLVLAVIGTVFYFRKYGRR